ncbi:PAS domain-containing protein [Sulfitobacter sp.]|uniref:PAS domain-containing protein n=1 Tax=Sulfitobacter sp. TaxID=1903071 RepID=UPI003569F7C2
MLKLQSAYAPMDFLAGTGEMARRIQTHDWYNHPFGPAETWPQSLRSALSICLNSAFATAIYWGPELRLLYNDAWAPIPGPRHPEALGARAEDIWHDIWHIIEPQFAELIQSGEGLVVEDQSLPMRRFGFEEETYWSYSFTPLRAEDGRIVGIFNSGSETTARVIRTAMRRF